MMLGTPYFLVPWGQVLDYGRTTEARLRVLRRRRAVLGLVWLVVAIAAGTAVAALPLQPIAVLLLLALVALSVVDTGWAVIAVVRTHVALQARVYERRFPPSAFEE